MRENNPPHIIIHGTGGSPNENWFPWLKAKLESEGAIVSTPQMPEPSKQNLPSWKSAFKDQVGALAEDSILIGHSIGCAFILRLLEESDVKVKAIFLVSAWQGLLNNAEFDPLIQTFFEAPFDFKKIKANGGAIYQYHGDNDPYVSLSMAKELSVKLGSRLVVINSGGHLNAAAGFIEFKEIFADIERIM